MWPSHTTKKSFFFKIMSFTALLSFIPFVVLGLYSFVQINSLSTNITQNQIQQTLDNVLKQKSAILQKEADLINMEFLRIEEHLKLLQQQAEYLFANNETLSSRPNLHLVQGSKGYLWEPFDDEYEKANIFISVSASKSLPMRDLATAKQLEPLLKQTIGNIPILKAVYFCFAESSWLVYPAIDVDYEVSINKLPPDIKVQDYQFYYIADQVHNPNRVIKWTDPYSDITHWEMVATAAIPVYLPSGKLRGVIGADFPIKFIEDKVLNFKFHEPHAFAFIRDNKGNFIAGQKKELFQKLLSEKSIKIDNFNFSDIPYTATVSENLTEIHGIQKISSSGDNLYLLSAPISSNGWILNFVIPESDIIDPIINAAKKQTSMQTELFTQRLLFFLFLGSLIVIVFSYYFSKTVTEPIKRLTLASQEIITGNYKIQIPTTSSDEIGHLTKTFNYMNLTIDKLINELTERANQLEERVAERTKALQEANVQLMNTFERLKKSETARTELIIQISHDLKTPLTSIKGYLQLINKYKFPPEQQKEFMELMLFRTNHIIQLIDDLLEISSMDLNETLEKEWVPVVFIVEHALEIAISKSVDTNIQVDTDYELNLPLIFVDPKKLNRALINILSNAIKYSGGQDERKVEIKAFQKDPHIVIEITDNGMGISEENIEKIFAPFYRDPEAQKAQIIGHGLGLSIAKKIIEQHQGEIKVNSKKGTGTTVSILLPYAEME